MTYKQTSVDLMGEHLYSMLNSFADDGNYDNAQALYDEWIVNDVDPEDGNYEFMFINDLTEVS